MRFRIRPNATVILILVACLAPGARAELEWGERRLCVSGGYDSNVNRVSDEFPPPGIEAEPDARAVVFGGLGLALTSGTRFRASADLQPYYVKYASEDRFDRGDALLAASATYELSSRWHIDATEQFRATAYPNRGGWDRVFNSVRARLVFRPSMRWWTSMQYRGLYRDNPRSNLDEAYANGVASSVGVTATDRLSLIVRGQVDFQTVRFVFPRDESGERSTVDLSARYLLGRRTLIHGKYLYQHDDMRIVFAQGTDFDKLGDAAEDATDGIFQSLRFLEDTDFNFSKHLFILSSHTQIRAGTSIDLLVLFERKELEERVLERRDRPERQDDTLVLQLGAEHALGAGVGVAFHVRYELSDSNDPDNDFDFVTTGLGLKYQFGSNE